MTTCNYCQSHPRFLIFHPADTGGEPRQKTCGKHLAMGVDEVMFETGAVEALVIENQAS